MDIEIVKVNNVSILDIKPGKIFEFNSLIYFKLKSENNREAVNIDTGEITTIDSSSRVKPLNSKLYIYTQWGNKWKYGNMIIL